MNTSIDWSKSMWLPAEASEAQYSVADPRFVWTLLARMWRAAAAKVNADA